ncbi:hypothetical protein WJX74_000528 [Apatococcus lobatus]|uniref:GLTSCR protein conserved domain-containing protein n=1 Tax=Apatococcus lobatus TaxID=904363 RepID=A0AAW1QZM4_9CHLO
MFADDAAAAEDCLKICNLDYNRPFDSLEDVVGRLLPFHVLAAQEEQDIQSAAGSTDTGIVPSTSQQAQAHADFLQVQKLTQQLAAIKAKMDGIQASVCQSHMTAEDSYQLERLLHQDAQQRLQAQRSETKQAMAEALTHSQAPEANSPETYYHGMDQASAAAAGMLQQSQPRNAASLSQQQAWAQYHIGPKLQQETRQPQPCIHQVVRPAAVRLSASNTFPGEDAPGTGHRHFPERVNNLQPARREGFSLKSSRECYTEFPTQVRASLPLHLPPSVAAEPAGIVAKQQPDAGPLTGQRRPPSVRDKAQQVKPTAAVLPEPDPQLVLEVAIRKGC